MNAGIESSFSARSRLVKLLSSRSDRIASTTNSSRCWETSAFLISELLTIGFLPIDPMMASLVNGALRLVARARWNVADVLAASLALLD